MNILCEIKSPCPSQKCEDGKDICIQEEGKCEYQRLEEAMEAEDIGIQCTNTECPYHEPDHDCEAAEGCAGYEGSTEV